MQVTSRMLPQMLAGRSSPGECAQVPKHFAFRGLYIHGGHRRSHVWTTGNFRTVHTVVKSKEYGRFRVNLRCEQILGDTESSERSFGFTGGAHRHVQDPIEEAEAINR